MKQSSNYVGVDIGGTSTKIALINETGHVSFLSRLINNKINQDSENFLNSVFSTITGILDRTKKPICGIGISSPGLQMKNERGTLYSINMFILNRVDLMGIFEERFKLPVAVCNDLVAHGLAESYFGWGRGVERFLSVSLGTGIGHTFFFKGVPQLSMSGVSGDSGRMILDKTSLDLDSMGARGTAEAMCGVRAIETLAAQKYPIGLQYSAHDVISMANQGNDPLAIEIMTIISHRLAMLLVNLSSIYFPYVISLTGGQTEAGDFFIEACRTEYIRLSHNFFNVFLEQSDINEKVEIVKSKTGGLTGLIGSIVPLIKKQP